MTDVTLENLQLTMSKMPRASRVKRLAAYNKYIEGTDKDFASGVQMFTKLDEVTYQSERDGKPRSLFNGPDSDFYFVQGLLVDVKNILKEEEIDPEPEFDARLPREHIFRHGNLTIHFYYMADSDNIQDSLWMTKAQKAQKDLWLAVGGDDNTIIWFHQGRRIEIECDVSSCDQSHASHFRDFFARFLGAIGLSSAAIQRIVHSYTTPGVYKNNVQGTLFTMKFLKSQLKTGVGHTSLANTLVVMSLMVFVMSEIFDRLEEGIIQVEDIENQITTSCACLGMKMKVQCFIDPLICQVTFHKRGFIWSKRADMYTAFPLPGTSLIKMAKVKCPVPTSSKRFWKILAGGALSREPCSNHPWVRHLITILVKHYKPTEAYIENPYASQISHDQSFLWTVGDGSDEDHRTYTIARYGITAEEYDVVTDFLLTIKPTCFYQAPINCEVGEILNRMWARDNV
eukprot:NODE_191_length_2216_cov_40.000000_g163_i0.p1 GENE.NODE_191_length_2216_cov_40.000000_g163_i0~~NODE_191_length_2216_cov_40.000000_g163_i0.p1  ORF type:complete len:500 (+),score=17.52 NODE_191_length_2216_cov_40.000000_g163_i0:134-1501(+)